MSKRNVQLSVEDFVSRMTQANPFQYSYKNPFILAFLYYTEGMSTVEMADLLDCEQRTVRRYMNYYGMKRFTKAYSLLVKNHGIEGALKIKAPEFYPLGIHND